MSSALATKFEGTNFLPVRDYVTQKDSTLAERFAAIILPFAIKDVARVADCSPETVKAWRAGRSLPYAPHLFPLARGIEPVRQWMFSESDPNPSLGVRIARLQQEALMPGEEGAIARATLNNIMAAARGA